MSQSGIPPKASAHEAPDFYRERALIVGEGKKRTVANAALTSLGLRERRGVRQIHANGKQIDSGSRNVRIGWYRPDQELTDVSSPGSNSPESPIDFEKAEISRRIGMINRRLERAQKLGIPMTPYEAARGWERIYHMTSMFPMLEGSSAAGSPLALDVLQSVEVKEIPIGPNMGPGMSHR